MSELEYNKKFSFDSPPPKPKPTEYASITIGIFFDGTNNNKDNTDHKTDNTETFRIKSKKGDSYYNDYSNVARMWEFYDTPTRIYIDGIGTQSNDKDDTILGSGLGIGKTGVRAKVRKGCEEIVKKIKTLTDKKKIEVLTLDAFGFSRGAAAARNFVYEINKAAYAAIPMAIGDGTIIFTDADGEATSERMLPEYGHLGLTLKQSEITVDTIVVRFLGIYDTVASYGIYHKNDVAELHLNEITTVNKIVHFTAQNEHRENFSLTNITSAKSKDTAHIEKSMPGVHSDIGGSYLDNVDETIEKISTEYWGIEDLERERTRIIEEGWFLPNEISIIRNKVTSNILTGTRRLGNGYSYIPMHFMCTYATTYRKPLPFRQNALEDKYTINNVQVEKGGVTIAPNDFLIGIKNSLSPYVFEGDEINISIKNLKLLRNCFLHWSARYEGIGMGPNIINGRRERRVFNG
jgi:Uncharacterized alpha/beta hydrolase domain (DUF2235)